MCLINLVAAATGQQVACALEYGRVPSMLELYAGTAVGILRTDEARRPLALKLGFKLFITAADFASDALYVGTNVFYSFTVWAFALFFTSSALETAGVTSGKLTCPQPSISNLWSVIIS